MISVRHRCWSTVVAAAILVTSPAHAATADALTSTTAAEQTSAPSSSVVVDASEVGTMRPAMVADVAVQATKVAIEANIGPAAVKITFVEVDPVEIIRGVRITITTPEATLGDPADPRGPLLAQCTACPDADLAGLAVEAMLTAAQRHGELVDAQRAASEPEPAPAPEPEPATEPTATPEPPPKKLGHLGWAGVATLSLGFTSTVAGAVLAALPPAPPPGEMRQDMLRDLRPAGFALVGTGAALLITGAVLLGIDRRAARQSTLSLAPAPAPGSWGLTIRGRF